MANIKHAGFIVKEARKMGVTVSDISNLKDQTKILLSNGKKRFILSDEHLYPDVTVWQRRMMCDKMLTQKILTKLKYKTIHSFDFNSRKYNSQKEFLTAIKKCHLSYPVITKVNKGTYGLGVTFIANEAELLHSAKELFVARQRFMIQPMLWHTEYRVTFIHGAPIMVYKKLLPQVVGNGAATMGELLSKQADDQKDANFIKWNLSRQKLGLKSVLAAGEIFETHIVKNVTHEYYKDAKFPKEVLGWGQSLLRDLSIKTVGVDFMAPAGLDHSEQFIIFELNSNPHWTHVIEELNDYETPRKISRHILKSYFGAK